MMMVPMVPSQSLHNGYVKYGRLLRSSGLSSGSVIFRPEKFFPQVTVGAPLGASDPLPPTRVGPRSRPLRLRRYHFSALRNSYRALGVNALHVAVRRVPWSSAISPRIIL